MIPMGYDSFNHSLFSDQEAHVHQSRVGKSAFW